MIRNIINLASIGILFVMTPLGAGAASNSSNTAKETIYISVKTTKLRSQPKQYAAGIASLNYGDSLTATENKDGWFRVKNVSGKEGYVHASAVTPRKVVLKTKSQFQASDYEAQDVVLAGKGVNPEVEKLVAQSNGSAVYLKEVDRMEKITVHEKELATFIQSGKLG